MKVIALTIFALCIYQATSTPVRERRQIDWNQFIPQAQQPQQPPQQQQQPTPAPGTTTTTPDPRFAACFRDCMTTPEYNPVCASNNRTYDNEGKMRCANRCGLSITKVFNGACSPAR